VNLDIWNEHNPGDSGDTYTPAGPMSTPQSGQRDDRAGDGPKRPKGGFGGQSAPRRRQKRAYRRHLQAGGARMGLRAFLAGRDL